MIYLYTGLNGTGKTSNVLWMFLHDKEYSGRPKFATYIKGFDYERHGVTQVDAEALKKWTEFPIGSVVMIDEAQKFFTLGRGEPEPWVKPLAENRHFGYDFLLTTPDGAMIHHYVRRLVNRHTHFIMKHGALVKALKWDKYCDKPDSPSAVAGAEPQSFKTPKAVFKLYTSTALDTRQVKWPVKTLATIAACLLLIALGMFYLFKFSGLAKVSKLDDADTVSGRSVAPGPAVPVRQASMGIPIGGEPARDPSYYVPRNPLDPSSAPKYDHLTKPSDFPRVAACMNSPRTGCNCYTQQATPVKVPFAVCLAMVKRGWFDDWKSARAQSEAVLSGRSDEATVRQEAAVKVDTEPQVTVVEDHSVFIERDNKKGT